ncbi:hypothetical protein [Streptomyces sp. OE57]|uniref:hypothetical protein n=1 Tax=Streptomyces lacaronensis TaxID=3379885 RepID=UPI0039B78CFD
MGVDGLAACREQRPSRGRPGRLLTGRPLDHRATGGAVGALAGELIAAAVGSSAPGRSPW